MRHDRGWWTWLQWTQSTGATSLQKAMVCPWDSSATFTHTHPNRYTTNVNTSLGKAVGGGEIFLECRALKWQWFRFRHRKIFPDDEVIERERHWAGRKSENPIQKNASVLVPSLTYLKALPSLSRVHKPPSERSRLLQASRNLQPATSTSTLQRGCALVGSVNTYYPPRTISMSSLLWSFARPPHMGLSTRNKSLSRALSQE